MCFQYLAFLAVSSALFGSVSLFYAGLYRSRFRRARRPLVVLAKLAIAVCVTVNSLVGVIAAFWMDRQRPYAVLVAEVVSCASWASHALAMWVFSTSPAYTGRGPLPLNIFWYLTLVASVFHFRSTIRWTLNNTSYQYIDSPDTYFSLLSRVTVYVHMGLQVLYTASLVCATERPKEVVGSRSRLRVRETAVSIQNGDTSEGEEEEEEEEVREKQPLIRGGVYRPTYGALTSADDASSDVESLNAYEDRANPISLVLFWWVWPLLRRGAMGHLETSADLPPLPKSLDTCLIREKFRNVLLQREISHQGRVTSISDGTSGHQVKGEGASVQSGGGGRGYVPLSNSEVMLRSVARLTPLPSTAREEATSGGSTETGPAQSADGADDRPTCSKDVKKSPEQSTSLLFLFSAMNRAFGWHYYPLGLLKFTTDLLGFAGPLLLYQLVSFIENKKVSCLFLVIARANLATATFILRISVLFVSGANVLWVSVCYGTSTQHTSDCSTHLPLQLSGT